ncbi:MULTISPECIES: glycosyltransferase family 2 protein [Enterobacteriaceae]|uniref:glycosyltransferase family 2 protein n=1 Tax=Enterobacteriaceae TaxID=543 RepID=UPI0004D9EFF3|nr:MULTISPECIES: glycosyltransferase family 2 protein [Enterobacteriaceae]KDS96050.1 hypothetical protein AC66_4837 [Escherichia coli 2-011-08_S4_C1]KDT11175.1 hypothetical protein AD24_4773 [Escherichia coli 2-011-08_S4_C3]MDH1757872.1 glycosyltransferase family 2 protein [Citrobacter braakii]MDH1856226.1 glycosyltransferase family 2 protein [Citrobacter braakii]MDQ9248560.1 glycosyltransferase family 2 protein [Escherichia coli]
MQKIIHKFNVKKNTVNKVSVSFKNKKQKNCVIIVTDSSNKIHTSRNVTGDREIYHSVFNFTGEKEQELFVSIKSENNSCKVDFVNTKEICKIYEDSNFKSDETSITAAIATYPGRINVLPIAIESLIHQVDHLFIYLNNYRSVPDFLLEHNQRDKITYILDTDSKKRAAAKFFWVHSIKGIQLTCDDDIIYPNNYVQNMVKELNKHPDNTIIAVHGAIYKSTVIDAIASREHVFNFRNHLPAPQYVHLAGTGTLCFRTKTLQRKEFHELWNFAASTDEWLACFSKRFSIKLLLIDRAKNWMKSIEGMTHGLHEEKQSDPNLKSKANNLIIVNNPWPPLNVPDFNTPTISPFKRKTNKLLRSPKEFFKDFLKKKVRFG